MFSCATTESMTLQSSTDNSSDKLFMQMQKMAGRDPKEHRDGHFMMPKEDILDKWKPAAVNIKYLIEKIEEVSPNHVDQALYEAANTFKAVCVDLVAMKDVMLNLHSKAMSNPKFGEKYITVLGQLSNHVVDNVPVRSELLSFIENEFKIKETMFQSDTAKFINAVILLGNVYHLVKIHGVPLKVLAVPMLDYLNLLLEGREDHHKVFAIQILLNGDKIFRTESLGSRLGLLKQSMRRALIARELTTKSKCWILLALDYMSNDLKPLSGDVMNFYAEFLGDDYVHVDHLLKPPTIASSVAPSSTPGITPSVAPSSTPDITSSVAPNIPPSFIPSIASSIARSIAPSLVPNITPSIVASIARNIAPSSSRSIAPSFMQSMASNITPSVASNLAQSFSPSIAGSITPSIARSIAPSSARSIAPSSSRSIATSFMPSMASNITPSMASNLAPSFSPSTARGIASENTLGKETETKSVAVESNTADSGDVFKDIENLTIPPELLNAVSAKPKPPRFCRFLSSGSRLSNNSNNINEREERNSHHTGGRESHQANYDEDDLYGIQIERDRIKNTLVKRN